ncbi:MAG: hypothetical protein Q8P18_12675 [Pseudomonadota bacterium]|nr:hypothetical protein [Pseudomonadota bacterium]
MMDPNVAFAAHLAALARVPDPEDRAVKGLLTAVVQDWSLLANSRAPSFELDGGTLWVRGAAVPLGAVWRAALASLEAALRDHGVGGARLIGPADRTTVLAFLRGARTASSGAPREALQRWVTAHGGGALSLLPPRPATARDGRDALRAAFQAWATLDTVAGPSRSEEALPTPALKAAVRALVDRGLHEPRALPVVLAFAGPRAQRRAIAVATLALTLGIRLGLPRGALADLTLAALEVASLPPSPDWDAIARRIAARATGHLGRSEVRLVQALWGAGPPTERAPTRHLPLFARIVALADEADALLRADGQGRLLPDEAIARLQAHAGRRHDGALVDALVSCLGRYPVGSAIVLDSGEVAIVCRAPASADQVGRPVVRVVVDRGGAILGGGPFLDLAQPARSRARIIATVDPNRLGVSVADAVLG